jgi:hypothetical protein
VHDVLAYAPVHDVVTLVIYFVWLPFEAGTVADIDEELAAEGQTLTT